MDQTLSTPLEKLPEFLTSEHLVQLGLYKSIDAAYQARMNGHGPKFLKLKHLILYPKSSLLEFIEKRMREANSSANCHNKPATGEN